MKPSLKTKFLWHEVSRSGQDDHSLATTGVNSGLSVLGFFPEFGNGHLGGIQASASTAWEAMSASLSAERICYGRTLNETIVMRGSRLRTVLSVLKRKKSSCVLLIWHLGMLKLLPFLRERPQRVIVFLHGIEVWKKQDWLTQQLLKRVDLFLTNSDYTWERFLSHNPSLAKYDHQTVWLGAHAPIPAESGSPQNPTALMLSRLSQGEDYKGHRELISAWPLVMKQVPNAQLWITGEGDLRPALERVAKAHGVAASVKFLGRVSEEKKEQLLQQSRCLVMPSRAEGFGLVYLEAMRVGRPCLVSTLDAGREVVNPPEAGLAADPDDQVQLVDAVCRLLTDGPEWQQWSEQARRRYEENYTAAQFQQRLLSALFPNNVTSVPPTDCPV